MSYSQPRDRLELRLKEIIDDQIGDVTDRRTRFDALLAAVVDPSVVPPDQRDRIELYLSELAGRAGGGVTPTGTVNIAANGTHNVSQYEYANVQVPAGGPDMAQLELMLGSVTAAGTYTPPAGYAYDQVRIAQDSTVITPGNIKKDVTILGVVGNYTGETPSGTVNIIANGTHNVSQYEYANVQVPGGSPTWDQSVDLSVTVVDGTYQLSLSVGVRSNTGNTLIWNTITPEEHEEDGYYSYTANLRLINGNGNISDGFYLTCSNGYDLSSWTQNNRVYKEIYHSGQVRMWYFFVPPDTTSFPIELTP